ncbi:hypothetical protein [Mobilitalea sibirica]|nr:hypothetical protein [Mobilitalea sibirica]
MAYSHPNEENFQNNMIITYNILEAAAGFIKKAFVASSEFSNGIVFSKQNLNPRYVPHYLAMRR